MASADDFATFAANLSTPATRAAAVTPSDVTDLARISRYLIVGTAGALAVITAGGDNVTLPGVPVGVLPLRVSRVLATGTTASNISSLS